MDVEALRRVLAERDVPVVFMTAHEQLRRRAAGLDGEPARGARGLRRGRRAALPRRLPLRRERLVREAARGRLRRHAGAGDRPRDGVAGGRHDDVREEGPARQHRRLARAERRRRSPSSAATCSSSPRASPPTAAWRGATWRRSRRACARRWTRTTCATASAPPSTSARRSTAPASRWCCRSAGTPSTSTRARFLPQIPPLEYPGQALAVALYREGGIRGCEIGTVMFGRQPDGSEQPAAMDLVRLAIPRRTYTQSHVDYVIEVCEHVARAGGRAARPPDRRGAAGAAPLHGASSRSSAGARGSS